MNNQKLGMVPSSERFSVQCQNSRFALERPLYPRVGESLNFKEKIKAVNPINPIHPCHGIFPQEFVNNGNNAFVVQSRSCDNELQSCVNKCVSEEEELVRYMSKVPDYLQRGYKLHANVLNFGVLEWRRLEKWKHKQNSLSSSGRINATDAGDGSTSSTSCSSVASSEALDRQMDQPSISHDGSFSKVHCSPIAKHLSGKEFKGPDLPLKISVDEKQEKQGKSVSQNEDENSADLMSIQGKEKRSTRTSHRHHRTLHKKKTSILENEPEKCAEMLESLGFDTDGWHCSGKQESIVVLLPKDFSRPGNSEIQRLPLVGQSTELNWGSFSDIFSLAEIHSDEPLSDLQRCCPLPYLLETETELDMKLDNLIKAQGVEFPVNAPDIPSHPTEIDFKAEASISTALEASCGMDVKVPCSPAEMTRNHMRPQRVSSRLGRATRSLSFGEGSTNHQQKLIYVGAKSGPANPEGSAGCEIMISHKAIKSGKKRSSSVKRLLNPLLKHRDVSQMKETPTDRRVNPPAVVQASDNKECEPSTMRAFLHLTVKGGLPLFKFMVERNNEILASTVKSLSANGKDNIWLYTFYSVSKVPKKGIGWENQKSTTCSFNYHVIGQMKVSNPCFLSCCDQKSKGQDAVESVLYRVDLSKSEVSKIRELAAIVVKIHSDSGKTDSSYSEGFQGVKYSNFEDNKIVCNTVVILPGGLHSLPHEGVPSSLINRWRSGGSCDCGGWDMGCKLRFLTNQIQDSTWFTTRSQPLQVCSYLFEQGEAKQSGPLFRMVSFSDGLFSVDFDAKISALQAFSICVAMINSHKHIHSSEVKFVAPERHAPRPPHSPVGRV